MPERNVELLQQTMQFIKDHPEQHMQEVWATDKFECGTAACFCGWAALLFGYTVEDLRNCPDITMTDMGADLLGLTYEEARDTFRSINSCEMLELMVKDLVNGDELRDWVVYYDEAHP